MALIEAWIGNYVTEDYVEDQDNYVLGPITARVSVSVSAEIVTYVNATVGMYSPFTFTAIGVITHNAIASWNSEFSVTAESGIILEAAATFGSSFSQITSADVSIQAAISVNVTTAVALNAQNLIEAIVSIDDVFLMSIHARATLRGDIDCNSEFNFTVDAAIIHGTATVTIPVAFTTTIVPDLFVGGTANFSSQFTQNTVASITAGASSTMAAVTSMSTTAIVYLFIEATVTCTSLFTQSTVASNFITLAGEYADYTWDGVTAWDEWPYEVWGPVGSLWMPQQFALVVVPRLILTGRVRVTTVVTMVTIPLLIHSSGELEFACEFAMTAVPSWALFGVVDMPVDSTFTASGAVAHQAAAAWTSVFTTLVDGIKVVNGVSTMLVDTSMSATASILMTPSVAMDCTFTMSTVPTVIKGGAVNMVSQFGISTVAAVNIAANNLAMSIASSMSVHAGIVFDISATMPVEFGMTTVATLLSVAPVTITVEFTMATVAVIDIQASATWTAFVFQVTIGRLLQPTAFRTITIASETRIAEVYQETRQLSITGAYS